MFVCVCVRGRERVYEWVGGYIWVGISGLVYHKVLIRAFSSFFFHISGPLGLVSLWSLTKSHPFYYRFLFVFSYRWTPVPNQPTLKTAAGRVQYLNRSCGYVTHQHWRWHLPLEVKSFLSNTVRHFGLVYHKVLIRAIFSVCVYCSAFVCMLLHWHSNSSKWTATCCFSVCCLCSAGYVCWNE